MLLYGPFGAGNGATYFPIMVGPNLALRRGLSIALSSLI